VTISIVETGVTYSNIQEAVNAAANGNTILISAGIFREQVTVSDGKHITIQGAGAGQTIIESPDAASLVANATDTNSTRPNKFAVITVKDNADVTIEGLTVDGRDQGAVPASNYVTGSNHDFLGIYVLNSDAHIDGVAVTGADELPGTDVSGVQRNHAVRTAVARSMSGRWRARRLNRRALSRTLQSPTTGTFSGDMSFVARLSAPAIKCLNRILLAR
jgi:pectin methylesterase-like acyl-CoA thioesterase